MSNGQEQQRRRRSGRGGGRQRRSGAGSGRGAALPAEPIEVAVTRIGARGDGIAVRDGVPFYIPLTAPGDRVRVRPLRPAGDGIAAELVELVVAGPGRAAAPCPHFGRCGGCSLQHLSDETYVAAKGAHLADALPPARFGAYALAPLARTPPAARRRARFAALRPAAADAMPRLGFTERHRHDIVDLAVCPVLDPRIVALLPDLRALLAELLTPGARAAIAITLLDGGLDVVVEWPEPPGLMARERLAAFAAAADLARLSWRPGAEAVAEPVVQRRPPAACFAGVRVELPAGGFVQASAVGEAALVAAVQDGLGSAGTVADLFAGAGTFTLPLACAGARVHAIDADGAAVQALARAARRIPAIQAERRDLFARPLSAAELRGFDAVVFDPPRAGARAQAEQLARAAVPVIAAVSCNPDSLARDAQILLAGGYRIASVSPVDQFVWSHHLEVVAIFLR